MSYKYRDIHSRIRMYNTITGCPVVSSVRQERVFSLYCWFVTLAITILFVLMAVQMGQNDESNTIENFILDATAVTVISCAIFNNVYYAINVKLFDRMLEKLDRVIEKCLNNPLDVDGSFTVSLNSDHTIIKYYSLIPLYLPIAAVFYYLPIFFRSQAWFGLDGKKVLPMQVWIPYDKYESPYYEIVFFYVAVFSLTAAMQRSINDSFLLSLMSLQKSFYRHLRVTLEEVMRPGDHCARATREPRGEHATHALQPSVLSTHTVVAWTETSETLETEEEVVPCFCKVEEKLKLWIEIYQDVIS